MVPIKLVNGRAAQLAKPIFDFLDLVPGYFEADISGWFLLFFCIFFGMIFGDAGYGILLFIISIISILRTRKTGVHDGIKLLLIISLTNTAWGVLTCAWFGMPAGTLPQFLRDISLSWISTAKTPQVYVDQNLKIFCFSLALAHLGIARFNNFLKYLRMKNLKFFAELGMLAMLAGIYNLVLFLVVSDNNRSFALHPASPWLIGAGVFLNLVFSSYEGNLVKSILDGLTNIMSVILGASGIFSDIMSYIRLGAVGMAGASVASLVSNMASPMLGSFLFFIGIIVMVFGHGLNMVLSVLSVMIHGVRLNTIEFSGHAGVSWSGITYKPFTDVIK
jgi:V/A-type H+-transporting ATPase subunit I